MATENAAVVQSTPSIIRTSSYTIFDITRELDDELRAAIDGLSVTCAANVAKRVKNNRIFLTVSSEGKPVYVRYASEQAPATIHFDYAQRCEQQKNNAKNANMKITSLSFAVSDSSTTSQNLGLLSNVLAAKSLECIEGIPEDQFMPRDVVFQRKDPYYDNVKYGTRGLDVSFDNPDENDDGSTEFTEIPIESVTKGPYSTVLCSISWISVAVKKIKLGKDSATGKDIERYRAEDMKPKFLARLLRYAKNVPVMAKSSDVSNADLCAALGLSAEPELPPKPEEQNPEVFERSERLQREALALAQQFMSPTLQDSSGQTATTEEYVVSSTQQHAETSPPPSFPAGRKRAYESSSNAASETGASAAKKARKI